jgi:catechol 2,3-dioxygenase-like lactoylglutathione lyase family enzyme
VKRFHVHLNVDDIQNNVDFYTRLFGTEPAVRKHDYAKWMLEDPRINFAISSSDRASGIDHLGLQAEDASELSEIGARLEAANAVALKEIGTTCCYARSDKFWAADPQGTRWESFLTFGDAPTYHTSGTGIPVSGASCCGPATQTAAPTDCGSACSVRPDQQIVPSGSSPCCA